MGLKSVWICKGCPGEPGLCVDSDCFEIYHTKFDFSGHVLLCGQLDTYILAQYSFYLNNWYFYHLYICVELGIEQSCSLYNNWQYQGLVQQTHMAVMKGLRQRQTCI